MPFRGARRRRVLVVDDDLDFRVVVQVIEEGVGRQEGSEYTGRFLLVVRGQILLGEENNLMVVEGPAEPVLFTVGYLRRQVDIVDDRAQARADGLDLQLGILNLTSPGIFDREYRPTRRANTAIRLRHGLSRLR